jgi:hypothetical protein
MIQVCRFCVHCGLWIEKKVKAERDIRPSSRFVSNGHAGRHGTLLPIQKRLAIKERQGQVGLAGQLRGDAYRKSLKCQAILIPRLCIPLNRASNAAKYFGISEFRQTAVA